MGDFEGEQPKVDEIKLDPDGQDEQEPEPPYEYVFAGQREQPDAEGVPGLVTVP
jgi:hypothetical protein